MSNERHLSFKAQLDNIRQACEFVAEAAEAAGLDDRAIYHCELAVDEACTNIILHGFGQLGDAGKNGQIDLRVGEEHDAFVITILDNSPAFNPLNYEEPDPKQELDDREPGGWGIYFIRKLMDAIDYRYEDGKNQLILRKHQPRTEQIISTSSGGLGVSQKELEKGYWQFSLSGRLDSQTSHQLEETLKKKLASSDKPRFIVNLAEVEYISSSGLKVLVSSWRKAREKDGDVLLTSMQPRIREVFEMIGFDMMFSIYDSPEEAIQDDPIGS
jgi:anti-anti-sigma factor